MRYSAYKLNKVTIYSLDVLLSQFETSPLFPVWFWLLILDLHTGFSGGRRYSHLFKNFPQFVVIHTVKDFGIINEADFFFWNSLAFSMIQQMLAIWSLVPLPFLNPAWTSGSSWFTYFWSLAWLIYWVLWLDHCNETLTPTHEISAVIPVRALQPGNWQSQQSSVMVPPTVALNCCLSCWQAPPAAGPTHCRLTAPSLLTADKQCSPWSSLITLGQLCKSLSKASL